MKAWPTGVLTSSPGAASAGGFTKLLMVSLISGCVFVAVYTFPVLGIQAATSVVVIQVDYCAFDIISRRGVG